jgi:hypothetical protein
MAFFQLKSIDQINKNKIALVKQGLGLGAVLAQLKISLNLKTSLDYPKTHLRSWGFETWLDPLDSRFSRINCRVKTLDPTSTAYVHSKYIFSSNKGHRNFI